MQEKTFRPNAEGLTLTFPNAQDGKTVEVGGKSNPWPYTTQSADEQRFLEQHPLVLDASDEEAKALGRMNKSELLEEAGKQGVQADDSMTKTEIVAAIEAGNTPEEGA